MFPDLIIQLGNNKYTIPAEGYTFEGGVFGDKCIIAVSSIPDRNNMYILGDTFIRNYYAVFNYSELQVGLAVSATAPSGVEISDDVTSNTNSGSSLTPLEITAIVLASILALLILIFVIMTCRNKRRQKAINKAVAEASLYQA